MCYEWPFVYLFHLGDIESKMVKEITEEGGSLWRCQVCDYVTKQKGALFEHVESKHTLSDGYNCHVCGKFCPTRNALRSHVSRQHPRNTWNVKVIHNTQKCFHKVFKYYLHSIKYMSLFSCSLAPAFPDPVALAYFIKRHYILWYFVYLLYFKHVSFLSELTEQIRSKMIKDPIMGWKCSDCGYGTKNNSVLYEHIESKHVDHPGYECDICSKFCSTRNSLRNHKSLKHRDREPKTRYIFQN